MIQEGFQRKFIDIVVAGTVAWSRLMKVDQVVILNKITFGDEYLREQ